MESNAQKLDHWVALFEVYFDMHSLSLEPKISFPWLRVSKHALIWFKSLLYSIALRKEAPISSWDQSEELLRKQFYHICNKKEKCMKLQFFKTKE